MEKDIMVFESKYAKNGEKINWNSYDKFKEYDAHLTRLHDIALRFDVNEARAVLSAIEDTHPELLGKDNKNE